MGAFHRIAAAIACLVLLLAAGPADAAFVYVGDGTGGGQLWQFGQDLSGAVNPLAPPTVDDTGMNALGLVVSPDGHSLYATENGAATGVYEFDIGADGTLTPKAAPMIAFDGALATPIGADLAATPNGKSLYVSDLSGLVWQFSVDAAGVLSHKSTPSVAGGVGPGELAVSPDGKRLYALQTKAGGTTILQFDIGSSGALKPKDPPSAPLPGANGATGLVVSPDGASLYATGNNSQVYEFDVAADGSLSAKSQPTVSAPDPVVGALAVSPDGQNLYAGAATTSSCTTGAGQILHFSIGAGGQLSAVDSVAAAPAGSGERDLAVSADGGSLYASESCSLGAASGVRQFDVGAGGTLTPKSTPFLPTGPSAADLALSPAKIYKLAVNLFGTSSGTVSYGGVACPSTCSQRYRENTTVVLTETPSPGANFVGWAGPCQGTAPTCTVFVNMDQAVSATFVGLSPPTQCTLTASNRVPLTPPPGRSGKAKVGKLAVVVQCDDSARATVSGTITERGPGRVKRTYNLRQAVAGVDAYTDKTLLLALPNAALKGLRGGALASAALRVRARNQNGVGRASVRVPRLHT